MSRHLRVAPLLAAVGLPGPACAECLGGGCYDGFFALIFGGIGYGGLGLVILILLARAKWRKAGAKLLAAVVVIAVGVPLLSQGWQAWKRVRMESHEVVGQPPPMTGRVPLLVSFDPYCNLDLCGAVVGGRGRSGITVVQGETLQGLDLAHPLSLADLPLEHWVAETGKDSPPMTRVLSPAERKEVAAKIDYVIIVVQGQTRANPGAFDAAIPGMSKGDALRFAMAPLDPADGMLSLAGLRFDVLDISQSGRALGLPLAPYNWQYPANSTVGAKVVIPALCPTPDGKGDAVCRDGLQW